MSPPPPSAAALAASCACTKPGAACVCDRLLPHGCAHRLLVLQHPQEADALLGTVPLLRGCVPSTAVRVGLSWRNLAAALGAEPGPGWAVVYPGPPPPVGDVAALRDARGAPLSPGDVRGLVLLDGSWRQAKALWWRNPWLLKLARLTLAPVAPSMYGRLRRVPRPAYLSTLEAAAAALEALGTPPAAPRALRRCMRTMLQRLRQGGADLAPPPDA